MDTWNAFMMGETNRHRELMVFDWEKAAQLIKERKPEVVSAGLAGDWEWTGGDIWRDGKPVTDSYTFLSSTWATPEIELDGVTLDCYRMESEVPGWDSETKWPKEALDILGL